MSHLQYNQNLQLIPRNFEGFLYDKKFVLANMTLASSPIVLQIYFDITGMVKLSNLVRKP